MQVMVHLRVGVWEVPTGTTRLAEGSHGRCFCLRAGAGGTGESDRPWGSCFKEPVTTV